MSKKKSYPGGKGAGGVAETIIRQMPPHATYIELFAGSARVFFKKRPAARSVLVDLVPSVTTALTAAIGTFGGDVEVLTADAMEVLRMQQNCWPSTTLVYADPPYLRSLRTRWLYEAEMGSAVEHAKLLGLLVKLNCMVMVSGYRSSLYTEILQDWRLVTFNAMTRGGIRTEHLWCNFPAPTVLHDPRYVGKDYRDRERLKRKKKRWADRLKMLPALERQVLAEAFWNVDRVAVEVAMRTATPE